jgi:hypothetical protein
MERAITFWRDLLTTYSYSSKTLSFSGKERGMLKTLHTLLKESAGGDSPVTVFAFLEYAVAHWGFLRPRVTWENSQKSKLGVTPAFVEVFFNKEDILRIMGESPSPEFGGSERAFTGRVEVFTKVSDVPKDHPQRDLVLFMIEKYGKAELEA